MADGRQTGQPPLFARLRALTGFEEDFLERSRGDRNSARICNEVLARCLVAPGDEPGEAREWVRTLSVADRDRWLVELRRRSLGDQVRTEVECPRCGDWTEVNFRLSDLPIETEPSPTSIEGTLDDGRPFLLRGLTAGDQEALIDSQAETDAGRLSQTLARVLLRLGDESAPFDEARIHALPVGVRQCLRAALDHNSPGLDLTTALACNGCGQEIHSSFEIEAFFLPS